MLPCGKAVNRPRLCAATGGCGRVIAGRNIRRAQIKLRKGPKVLLGELSRRCYREATSRDLARPGRTQGSELCINDTGSEKMTMAATAGGEIRTGGMTAEERKVIFASSLGTVFEWYDFYIYGTLGVFLAKYFFSNVPPNVGFIFALLAFAAGFAVRPFGALIFGRLGDLVGRKYTFLITMSLMGVGTFFIGLLPGYATWGIAAPIVLIALRLVQGLALGGEYGGAAIYVAEHAPPDKRGYYTSWIQTTATLGLFLALLLILGIRSWMGEAAFGDWGWRLPFLLSGILLAVSIWIRLSLSESPIFAKMKEEGTTSKRPLSEAV